MSCPESHQTPIVDALRAAGYELTSLSDLRRSGVRYRAAVPVLIDALQPGVEPRTLEEVVRALSVPWASPEATGPMIKVVREVPVDPSTSLHSLRWAMGNALEVLWDDRFFDELVGLVRDRSYGRDREMIALGLRRSKRPEAADVLIEALKDPDINGHATKALVMLKDPRARPGLEAMLSDRRAWVRKEARRALDALS